MSGAHWPNVRAVVCLRRGHERAVVRLDRLVRDDAGKDELAAAARSPVVRLRLPDRDLQIGGGHLVQEPDWRAARGHADVRVRVRVLRVVLRERPAVSLHARETRGPPSARCPDSDIRNTFPFAQQTRTSATPAASMVSNTAGRSFEEGVGRNWLSITTATLALPTRSSANVGPLVGSPSARRAAAVGSSIGSGSSGWTTVRRLAVGMSSSRVSRCFFDSSSVAPMASGSHRFVRDHDTCCLAHRSSGARGNRRRERGYSIRRD